MSSDPVHVVSIMNYQPEARVQRMCRIFLDQLLQHGAERVTILYEDAPPILSMSQRQRGVIELRQGHSVDVGHPHFNLRFKLANLAALKEPFIFLDADTAVLGDLRPLWALRHAKPWIGVNHQWVPSDARTHRSPFLNSGVQLVGDPAFYNLDAILAAQNAVVPLSEHTHREKKEIFACPGADQAVLFRYFTSIGYDYTHPEVGPEWNCCAGLAKITRHGDSWQAQSLPPEPPYQVNVVHYWSQFKPWNIGCPLYASYTTVEER